jgi:hypothetical protein
VSVPVAGSSTRAAAQALLRDALSGGRPSVGPWLVIAAGIATGRRLTLAGDQVLGRSPSASLRLEDPHLSRRHARVTCEGSDVAVEDLGSRSGTLRNGRRLPPGVHRLAPGDEIQAGATRLRLVASLDEEPGPDESLPDGSPPAGPGHADGPAPGKRPARPAWWGLARAPAAAALLLAACALALALAAL